MSQLLIKSEQNLNASGLLIQKDLYASSVHCSYYAMLQYLKNRIKECLNISFLELENMSRTLKKGSHEFLLDEALKICKVNSEVFLARDLRNGIKDLKTFRTESDYHNIEVTKVKSEKALILSGQIIEKLKRL